MKHNDKYTIESWLSDLISIIKNRAFLDKKESAYLVFQENATFFLDRYEEKCKPMEAFVLFEEGDDL